MGKTFMLKMIGLQKVKPELKNKRIEDAGSCGRILSFDFAKNQKAIQSLEDIEYFFTRLMIYFLCFMFDGAQVDGINFNAITDINKVSDSKCPKFNEWFDKWHTESTEFMIKEYMRLTNLAFNVEPDTDRSKAPPVFLLDEVQSLCEPTNVKSKAAPYNYHTQLSLLLTELAVNDKPICICTGTSNGDILSLSDFSAIIPKILSLTFLAEEYWENWREMTNAALNTKPSAISMEQDKEIIRSLAFMSYQVPRLLAIAHQVWFQHRPAETLDFIIRNFESEAKHYYHEMFSIFINYKTEELAHIIFCCGVDWTVLAMSDNVPGTTIKWEMLIRQSIIFPSRQQGSYLFPFNLVWHHFSKDSNKDNNNVNVQIKKRMKQVEEYCEQIIPNLNIKDLFLSYKAVCLLDLYNLGMCYESLFVASLAVKYYLTKITSDSSDSMFLFSNLCLGADENLKDLKDFKLDLSDGIYYPEHEAFADDALPRAVVHNCKHHKAHHDILLPSPNNCIPVSVKASFDLSPKNLAMQTTISKKTKAKVHQLILLYLGDPHVSTPIKNVFLIDGKGVCNRLSLDILKLCKTIKSEHNRPITKETKGRRSKRLKSS